jgi:hypothetical protein
MCGLNGVISAATSVQIFVTFGHTSHGFDVLIMNNEIYFCVYLTHYHTTVIGTLFSDSYLDFVSDYDVCIF